MRRVVGENGNNRGNSNRNYDEESKRPSAGEYREKGIVDGKIQYVNKKPEDPYSKIKGKGEGVKGQ